MFLSGLLRGPLDLRSATVKAVRAHLLLVGLQERAVLRSILGWLQVLRERLGSSPLLVLIRDSDSPHSGVRREVFPQELFVPSSGSF